MIAVFIEGFYYFQQLFRDMLLPFAIVVFAFAYLWLILYIFRNAKW